MRPDYVEQLKRDAAALSVVRTCATCRHRRTRFGEYECRETGFGSMIERSLQFANISRCGPSGRLWEPRPEGFLSQLWAAIVSRIRG